MYNIYGRKYYPGTRNKNDSFPFPPQLSPILVEKKQSHPSYSRKLRGSTSEGISKDPSARSIRKKTVEYSIPRAISIPSRWFPRRDPVNENIILVVRGLVRSVHPILFPFCIPRPSSLRSASGPSFRQLLSVPTSSPEIILLPILVHLPPLHCQPPRFSTLFFRPFSFPFFLFFSEANKNRYSRYFPAFSPDDSNRKIRRTDRKLIRGEENVCPKRVDRRPLN